ncbi:MAG: hypothetical protein ABFS39_13905 [Pseudomonadota bacterium]
MKKLESKTNGGTLEVLRRGFSLAGGGTLKMSQSWPEDDRNEKLMAMYEAHNSQTGQAASKLRAVLTLDNEDELETLSPTEIMAKLQEAWEFPDNVSYFAFTATPKHATLTLFGRPDTDGMPHSFHLYSMRQAIEESFIINVLEGYMPYRVARRLSEAVDHDKRVDAKQAARALARWAALHPTNMAQKVEFIIEHFRRNVAGLLHDQAKAMVVTSSRAQAVVFKCAFDDYIR